MQQLSNSFNKRLKNYSALAASLLAMQQYAGAQIIYTQLNPEVNDMGNGATYNLDMNNDDSIDYTINITSRSSGAQVLISPASGNSNSIAGLSAGNSTSPIFPLALHSNYLISSNAIWNNTGAQLMAGVSFGSNTHLTSNGGITTTTFLFDYGEWLGVTDRYLGLKFKVDSNTYYGWVRMDVASMANSFTVKDYAYQSTPNTPISAGDKGDNVGIASINKNQVHIFSANKHVTVQMVDASHSVLITVENLLGEKLKAIRSTNMSTIINLSDLPTGIYIITIEENGKFFSKKITLE